MTRVLVEGIMQTGRQPVRYAFALPLVLICLLLCGGCIQASWSGPKKVLVSRDGGLAVLLTDLTSSPETPKDLYLYCDASSFLKYLDRVCRRDGADVGKWPPDSPVLVSLSPRATRHGDWQMVEAWDAQKVGMWFAVTSTDDSCIQSCVVATSSLVSTLSVPYQINGRWYRLFINTCPPEMD